MIIDLILDRRGGVAYDPAEFYNDVRGYVDIFPDTNSGSIAAALEGDCEQRVKLELCLYVLDGGYNPEICDYINSVSWLPDWWDRN